MLGLGSLNANRPEDCAGRCVSRSQSYMLMLAGGGSINYRFCGFFIRLFSVSWVEFGGFWGLTRSFWAKVGFVAAMLLIAKGHNERKGRRGGKQIPSALLREGSSTPGCAPPRLPFAISNIAATKPDFGPKTSCQAPRILKKTIQLTENKPNNKSAEAVINTPSTC